MSPVDTAPDRTGTDPGTPRRPRRGRDRRNQVR
ncbi:MAG: hypothetical protein QOE32_1574, partial [Pseudonocardiales bacterium]|nr:hypothetical protein [Pseudonocardiales bacterium]